ncbi:MAG: wax ester/triacylglycerol synthase family O-acyltransferase [Deltaproteobacteria bacterium]|nr:wax ester/triacylglycerol synthase family O-acyltransferase [Deltaproteobacteria bacterium]
MAHTYYDRLSAMDAMFLEIEDAQTHMHVGSVGLYELGPLRKPDGGLDFERVHDFAESQLHKNPRFRQRIEWIPTFDRPVWVDDASFNLAYHLRHTSLPRPGDERQLKRMVGRILSQKLDVGKPLWEIWVIEGVEGDRFAVLSKLHHCVADGVAGSDLLNMLMGTDPNYEPDPNPHVWKPRMAPAGRRLMLDEALRQASAPLKLLRGSAESAGKPSGQVLDRALEALRGVVHAAEAGLHPASQTPLNAELGPHRRFDWTQFDLGEIKRAGKRAGGTVNDVALAIVAGAVRRYLLDRAGAVDDLEFRVAVPVNMRTSDDDGHMGNRASSMVVTLPLAEKTPEGRLERIVELTREIKRSGESQAVDLLGRFADFLPPGVMAHTQSAVNMVVTNVPGPPVPVYLLGARMLAAYPVVPLMPRQGLGIAMLSYNGGFYCGLNSDWDAVPDLHDFVEEVAREYEAIIKLGA